MSAPWDEKKFDPLNKRVVYCQRSEAREMKLNVIRHLNGK